MTESREVVLIDSYLATGDLSKFSAQERSQLVREICESVGLNPLTRPLEYLTLNGKLTLYANKTAAAQLCQKRGISTEIIRQEKSGEVYWVTVRARDREGNISEDMGGVPVPSGVEEQINAALKAITKAKRRAVLSLCGLGYLDATELETIPGVRYVNESTGEIIEPQPPAIEDAEVKAQHRLFAELREAGYQQVDKNKAERSRELLNLLALPGNSVAEIAASVGWQRLIERWHEVRDTGRLAMTYEEWRERLVNPPEEEAAIPAEAV